MEHEIKRLEALDNAKLQAAFREFTGEVPKSHNRQWIIRHLAWKVQAKKHGGFSSLFIENGIKNGNPLDIRLLRK